MTNFHFKGGAGRAYQGIVIDKPYNGMPQTNGAHRSSVILDGVNSTFQSNESLIGIEDEWTIGLWVRPSSVAADRMPLIIKPAGSDNSRIEIELAYLTGGLGLFGGTTVRLYDSAGVLKKDWDWWFPGVISSWHNIVITWDGSDIVNYYEGSPIVAGLVKGTDNALTMTDEPRQIEVGSNSGTPDGYVGWISELQIWDEVLDADEIRHLHNHGFPGRLDLTKDVTGYTSSANLQHWYRFGYDAAKIGRDLTLVRDRLDIDSVSNNVDEDAIRSASPRGSSARFTADSHLISDEVDLGFADEFTISVWFRRDADVDAVRTIYEIKEVVGDENRILVQYGGGGGLNVYIYDSGATVYRANFSNTELDVLPNSAWSNFVITKVGLELKFYVNGMQQSPELITGTLGSLTNTNRKVAVGANIVGGQDIVSGYIPEFAIWNSVLTQNELVSIYNNGVYDRDLTENFEDYVSQSSLKQWWWLGSPAKSTETGNDVAVRKAGNMDLTTTTTALTYISIWSYDQCAGSGTVVTLNLFYGQSYFTDDDTCKNIGISDIWTISGWFRAVDAGSLGVVTDNYGLIDLRFSNNGAGSNNGPNRIVMGAAGEVANNPFRVLTTDSNDVALIERNVISPVDGVGYTFDAWRHFVVTWNGYTRTVVIYLNGIEATQTGSNSLGSGNQVGTPRLVEIGRVIPPIIGDIRWWNGNLCDFIMWNKELSAREARQIYALGHTFNPFININAYRSGQNLMHWWPLHDVSDTNTSIGQDKVNYKGLQHNLTPATDGGFLVVNDTPDVTDRGMFIGMGPYDNMTV